MKSMRGPSHPINVPCRRCKVPAGEDCHVIVAGMRCPEREHDIRAKVESAWWAKHPAEAMIRDRESQRGRAKLRADLAEATALLREVERREIAHHDSGRIWCDLRANTGSKCTCGQWSLVERIEAFTAKQPAAKEAT